MPGRLASRRFLVEPRCGEGCGCGPKRWRRLRPHGGGAWSFKTPGRSLSLPQARGGLGISIGLCRPTPCWAGGSEDELRSSPKESSSLPVWFSAA